MRNKIGALVSIVKVAVSILGCAEFVTVNTKFIRRKAAHKIYRENIHKNDGRYV